MTADEARILAEIVRSNNEIAKALIGAQVEAPSTRAPMADACPDPTEWDGFSAGEDWEDIPEEPYGNVVALPREVGAEKAPEIEEVVMPETVLVKPRLHLNEDEEDAVARYQLGRISFKQLEEVMEKAKLPNPELLAEVPLPTTTPQAT